MDRFSSSQVHGAANPEAIAALGTLVYELLDAHADTAALMGESAPEQEWASHLAYLSGLQRVGREILARCGE